MAISPLQDFIMITIIAILVFIIACAVAPNFMAAIIKLAFILAFIAAAILALVVVAQ